MVDELESPLSSRHFASTKDTGLRASHEVLDQVQQDHKADLLHAGYCLLCTIGLAILDLTCLLLFHRCELSSAMHDTNARDRIRRNEVRRQRTSIIHGKAHSLAAAPTQGPCPCTGSRTLFDSWDLARFPGAKDAKMSSFTYDGFMDPDWQQYEEPAAPYASVLPNAAYGYAPEMATYAAQDSGNAVSAFQHEPGRVPSPKSTGKRVQTSRENTAISAITKNQADQNSALFTVSLRPRLMIRRHCDGGEPCQPCSEQATSCKYRPEMNNYMLGDGTMEKVLQLAERYNTTLASLNDDIDVMNTTLRSIEARLDRSMPQAPRSMTERRPKGQLAEGILTLRIPCKIVVGLRQPLPDHLKRASIEPCRPPCSMLSFATSGVAMAVTAYAGNRMRPESSDMHLIGSVTSKRIRR
ncbi:uncharacterized protein MYCFIDRAFT_169137 [Pseudocercospora fijiensis CIRAD86]|uniref:Zn(2)-C6 fungal-type domain-containing protein n=1 Tax=Pseudocercospora fijiensis (strain CIRAD86) TaxID=383855 RepID=N1Q5N4_PSEFD|nr:uncharacterized protein MYCFIDRAFT_169137 [Pseudocercospora fijiensis CIRAD86]EME87280.1 hypothetical protein MYCFIDRAFT_169137 [Pseudocercospora fijiensis CIRAD86]